MSVVGKRISIVFEETPATHDGLGFNVFLDGISDVRRDEISAMTPEVQLQELSTAEFWALRCFQITAGALMQSGADANRSEERWNAQMSERKDQMQTHCGLAETLHGTPIGEHLKPVPSGMQKDYVVLTAEERAKGFVEPVRRTYLHLKCGSTTTMGHALAETYARCPTFYSGTFCCACGNHFPVGEAGEFVWDGTNQKVGTTQKPHGCEGEGSANTHEPQSTGKAPETP